MRFHNSLIYLLLFALLLLTSSNVSFASAGGTLTGTVTDLKGGTIAEAVISVIDPVSNQTTTATSDSQGKYKLEGLPPGTYAVTVTAKGFRDARKENVKLDEDKSTLADFKLEPAQVEATVTVAATAKANTEATYRQLRKNADDSTAFSGNALTVSNLVLKKDAATFTLKSGELYFLAPVEDRTTGAVFLGDGELTLTPPTDSEKTSLAIFVDDKTLTEQFNQLVLRFTDKTFEEIKASPNVSPNPAGSQAAKARDAYREKLTLLRKQLRTNLDLRTLMDVYSPRLPGYFLAFVNGKRYSKLIYHIDPLGLAAVPPEEVALISYGTQDGGVWTSFHLADEYARGRASSSQDHRVFDITRHEIDTQIKGSEIIATDRISFVALSSRRVLPFNLYPSLRVKTVKDEQGKELEFVQEAKDEDGDFGVILPGSMQPGKTYALTVSYQGGDALRDLGGGNYFLIPRESWYPSNGGALFGDRAIFDVTVRYPKSNVFVGTGAPVGAEADEANARLAKWSSGTTELAVAGFNYGKFKKKELVDKESGYGIEFYANTQLAPDIKMMEDQIKIAEMVTGENIEQLTAGEIRSASGSTTKGGDLAINSAQNALRIYNSYFGKLPYTRIAMTQQPAGFFGQAWPTLVYMPYTAFLDPTQRHNLFGSSQAAGDVFWQYVGPHEVAHQWWGHVVGWSSYRDQWISEGFAEFSASLWVQQVKGIGKFVSFWEEQRKMIVEPQLATKGRKPYTIGPITAGYRLNTGKTGGAARFLIYPKGAYVLHMLRMLMYDSRDKSGDPDARFKAMMQDFVKTYFNQDASTEDFKRVVEKHMTAEMDLDGNRRMDWFFNQWVYGTEVPAYKFEYSVNVADGKTVLTGKIMQQGVSDNFKMRVPLWVDSGKGWVRLGAATLIGNSSLDLPQITLAQPPKRVAIAALNDVLATEIQTTKR